MVRCSIPYERKYVLYPLFILWEYYTHKLYPVFVDNYLYGRVFVGRIKMKTTDKKNKKAQPELLRVLDQPMISQLNGGKDSKKDHKDYLLKKAKEKK